MHRNGWLIKCCALVYEFVDALCTEIILGDFQC